MDDPEAQIIFAVKYYAEDPAAATHWLKEVSITSSYTSSLGMIATHYINHALEENSTPQTLEDNDIPQAAANSYFVNTKSEAFMEGAAWFRAAMLRDDPVAEMSLMDTDYADLPEEQRQIIDIRAQQIVAELNEERLRRGYPDHDIAEMPLAKARHYLERYQEIIGTTINNTQTYFLANADQFNSVDVLELAFDTHRLDSDAEK